MQGSSHFKYIILSLLFIGASINFTRTTLEILKSSQRLDELENEVNTLESTKKDLENSIEYKKTDEFVEEKARNDLNLVKPNEKIFIVKNLDLKSENYGIKDLGDNKNILGAIDKNTNSNLYQWYRLFFN